MKEAEEYGGLVLVSDSPHLNRLVAQMRHSILQKDTHLFKMNAFELGRYLAYETERRERFAAEEVEVKSVLGTAHHSIRREEPFILKILRAADYMVKGAEEIFRYAPQGFVDAKRREGTYDKEKGTVEISLNYESMPLNTPERAKLIEGKIVLAPDIMLASGSSLVEVCRVLSQKYGQPRKVVVNSVIAARPGIEHVLKEIADCRIYTAAIDDELNDDAYIVPGLGDAGDLCFNGKGQDPLFRSR